MNTNMKLPCSLLGDKRLGYCVTLNCIISVAHIEPSTLLCQRVMRFGGIIFLYLHLNNITMQLLWIICSWRLWYNKVRMRSELAKKNTLWIQRWVATWPHVFGTSLKRQTTVTFSRDVHLAHVFSSVIADGGFINTSSFSGKLPGNRTQGT